LKSVFGKSTTYLLRLSTALILICATLLVVSCRKKIIEVIPVIEVQSDMSIPGAGDIKYFSFPSEEVGYAASDTSFIYKTTDGGVNWDTLHTPNGGICGGIEFFDELTGICYFSLGVYRTDDGGQTWGPGLRADFVGKTEDGLAVIGSCDFSWCNAQISLDSGKTYYGLGRAKIDGDFHAARVVDGKVFFIGERASDDDIVYGMDLTTRELLSVRFANITFGNDINDLYLNSGYTVIAADEGNLIESEGPGSYSGKVNYSHIYPFYSVDGFGELSVAVGEKTIYSNLDFGSIDRWNEVFDTDLNGFSHTFYRIRFFNANTFIVSGSNGLIWKAQI